MPFPMAQSSKSPLKRITPEVSAELKHGEDFYYDDLGRMVFTEAYHLKRGTCCGNGCKHCPFDHVNVPKTED
jgi:hypothetical protein